MENSCRFGKSRNTNRSVRYDDYRTCKSVGLKRFVGKVEDVKDLKNSDNKPYYSLTNVAPNGLTLYSPTKDVAIYKYREDTVNTNSFWGFKYKTTTTVYKFDYIFY